MSDNTTADTTASNAREQGYVDQHRRDSQELRRLCAERDAIKDERDTLRAQLEAAEVQIEQQTEWADRLKHMVITCGVAATHPDPNLTLTGAYKEKWNSKQADDVRALRARAEAAEADAAPNEIRRVAKRNLRGMIERGSDDRALMLACLEELS